MAKPKSLHVRAAQIIVNLDWSTPSKEVIAKTIWRLLEIMYKDKLLMFAHKGYYDYLPTSLSSLFITYSSQYN